MPHPLAPFFNPSGVAIIGASASPTKLSFGILKNMTLNNYQGQIAPVNPKENEILGYKCYPDIASVPDPLELAVIVLPAPVIPETLEACGRRGLKAVNIISGGFKEVGPEGAILEKTILQIAAKHHMRLVGPNCVGTLDLYSGLNTTFINGLPAKGGIGFVSQSGAVGGGVVDLLRDKGIGWSNFSSLGNEADVTETDMIEYLAQDPTTRVIACYAEMIRDGQRFLETARQVTSRKPIVLLKAGRSEAGARAVSSHTGSLAGSHAAYRAAFQQAGVIEVESLLDLFDIATALDTQPLPQGKRVVMITNAGGPAALASDSLATNGLEMADLSPVTHAALRKFLNPAAQVANPVDMLGAASPQEYAQAVRHCLADPGVDMVMVIHVPQALVKPAEIAQEVSAVAKGSAKPVIALFVGEFSIGGARQVFHQNGIPMYPYPESTGRVLGALLRYRQWKDKARAVPRKPVGINQTAAAIELKGAQGVLGEAGVRPLFEAYGIPLIAAGLARSADEAVKVAQSAGFPVALKIVSPQILHKSDVGGIRLNLADAAAVEAAFHQMMREIAKKVPGALLEGVMVEKMAPKGLEVITGVRRDPNFGPLLMFGLGGIYVELFSDVAFRVAPVSREEALEMLQQTKAWKLLNGFRGAPQADVEAVVEAVVRLGYLALDFPQISEIEINPLLVLPKGQGALALDGRAILD